MSKEELYVKLKEYLLEADIMLDEPMRKHTSFKIGGPADIFIKIKTIDDLKKVLKLAVKEKISYKIIGNGSNILVKDEGFRGIIIKNEIKKIHIEVDSEVEITSASGENLITIGQICLKNELEGFEFATGIPGTLGGAIRMNAGAHGKEMKDVIESVTYIDENGNIKKIGNEQCDFEYRKSLFSVNNYAIIEATIKLPKGRAEEIKEKMDEYKKYRIDKQPVEFPNGGSTFKRGTDFITAKLVDDAGLKGYKIGGAEVSTKHAGFIINTGKATAQDVIDLAEYVQKTVLDKFGKKIELEIEII